MPLVAMLQRALFLGTAVSRGMQAGPSRVCSVLVAVVVVVCTASVGARFEATLLAAWLRWSSLTCA